MAVLINEFEIVPDPQPEQPEGGAAPQQPVSVSPREVALAVERAAERALRVEAC
jgi:hypothetical protein